MSPPLPTEPTLYPNLLAGLLTDALRRPVEVTVIARSGTTVRDLFRTLTKDRHVQFDVLPGADAVVVGIGGFDHGPAGVPPMLEAMVPYLRPAGLRRRSRRTLGAIYPWLVRLHGARRPRTPAAEFDRLFDTSLLMVRSLARGAAGVVLGPTSHDSPYYANLHSPNHGRAQERQFAIAERHGFATVPCWPLVTPHLDELNPDGIHWPPAVHAAVAAALAAPLLAQLEGDAARPPTPTWD